MADKQIGDMTAATLPLTGAELVHVVQGGNSRQADVNALRPRGTSFPVSPATGDVFYRTDRHIEYYYDGTRWLSTQLFTIGPFQPDSTALNSLTTSAGATRRAASPWNGVYDMYVL